MKMKKYLLAAMAAGLIAPAASATTLTLDAFGSGFFGNTVAVAPEATLTSFGSNLFFGGAYFGAPGSFCAISGTTCDADLEISFVAPVANLTFDVGGWDPGDFVALSIFGLGDVLSGSLNIVSNIVGLDLSSYGTITRLFFDDSSTAAGIGYANFSFDLARDSAPIPLPAAGWLLLGGLGVLAAAKRRRRTA